MKFLLKWIVIGSTLTLVGFFGFLYINQDQMLLIPGHESFQNWKQDSRYTIDKLIIENGYKGIVVSPKNPLNTVIFFHGNAGTVNSRQYLLDPFLAKGFRIVLVEYPGFGERLGSSTISNVKQQALIDTKLLLGLYPQAIVMGESFGSGVAAQVTIQNPDNISQVILATPWKDLPSLVHEKIPGAGWVVKETYDSYEALKNVSNKVYILGAEHDELIPIHHAKKLYENLPGSHFILIESAGHNDWHQKMTKDQWDQIFH
ncbi:MAG TPA: alpha/beta fold hydrolase [Ignavibacteriaceae bacterium]